MVFLSNEPTCPNQQFSCSHNCWRLGSPFGDFLRISTYTSAMTKRKKKLEYKVFSRTRNFQNCAARLHHMNTFSVFVFKRLTGDQHVPDPKFTKEPGLIGITQRAQRPEYSGLNCFPDSYRKPPATCFRYNRWGATRCCERGVQETNSTSVAICCLP